MSSRGVEFVSVSGNGNSFPRDVHENFPSPGIRFLDCARVIIIVKFINNF